MIETLYNKIFDLRNAQANCAPSERAAIERKITALFDQIKKMEK
jgi:hypothetical protein